MVGVAVKVTLVPEQIVVAEAEINTAVVTVGFTVMVTVLLVAEAAVTQLREVVSSQVITSPFASAELV